MQLHHLDGRWQKAGLKGKARTSMRETIAVPMILIVSILPEAVLPHHHQTPRRTLNCKPLLPSLARTLFLVTFLFFTVPSNDTIQVILM